MRKFVPHDACKLKAGSCFQHSGIYNSALMLLIINGLRGFAKPGITKTLQDWLPKKFPCQTIKLPGLTAKNRRQTTGKSFH
ncbi:hypothetical protein I5M27_09455 [Adhaeribacter sp. BT258]|uniref:Uncharacterized protein n=1 Tax=Adhaeribacter terrigena TaxID=2793070 RepID=A0ABS1C1D3_9BACT|nr:hypothetical protein [Adhaeribacter terrigena]MBK0403211.1 hypothetical protein [Adhaeribacter terrigena]